MQSPGGCPLCASRSLHGLVKHSVFATSSALKDHCRTAHWRRLALPRPHPPLTERRRVPPSLCLTDLDTTSTFAAALRSPPPARFEHKRKTPTPLSEQAFVSVRGLTGCVVEYYASVARELPSVVVVDTANVPGLFRALQGIDPAAEVTLRDTSAWFICVCEPCVDVRNDLGAVPYVAELQREGRFFVHRCHGGSEAGALAIADLVSRLDVELGCSDDAGVAETGALARLRYHLVGNDRRLARGLKGVVGISAPIIEHHAFDCTAAAWRDALHRLLELTYVDRG